MASHDAYLTSAHAEPLREKRDERIVGLSLHWWRVKSNTEDAVHHPRHFVPRSPRLNPNPETKGVASLLHGDAGHTMLRKTPSRRSRAKNATMGVMSIIPSGGMIERSGRMMGSDRVYDHRTQAE